MMRRLWTRLGLAALLKEPPAQRNQKGRRLDHSTSVVFLAPGHSASTRSQLFDLVEGVDGHGDLGSWSLVVDTGMTMKSHAKLRTQRIKKLEEGQALVPAFPQHPSVHLFWRDEVGVMMCSLYCVLSSLQLLPQFARGRRLAPAFHFVRSTQAGLLY